MCKAPRFMGKAPGLMGKRARVVKLSVGQVGSELVAVLVLLSAVVWLKIALFGQQAWLRDVGVVHLLGLGWLEALVSACWSWPSAWSWCWACPWAVRFLTLSFLPGSRSRAGLVQWWC